MPPKTPIGPPGVGIALIGSGIFAKTAHLPAILDASPAIGLRAVYSRSLASAAALTSGLKLTIDWYTEDTREEGRGYEDLLKREDIEGVIIALPILAQPEFIRKALVAGKHVLSEKPIAKDVATARELLGWYNEKVDTAKVRWAVAENFRFMESYIFAAEEVKKLGRMLQFRVSISSMVRPGGNYFETAWRKAPEYQGGFLLDGGIHSIAATRLLLGQEHEAAKVACFSSQLQEHLPPVDSIDATIKTKSGIHGTLSMSFGTSFKGNTYGVACEHGTVAVTRSRVVVTDKDGIESVKEFPFEGNGVKEEVLAWSKAIAEGDFDPRQAPEEALRDLEFLEALLKSGQEDGSPMILNS